MVSCPDWTKISIRSNTPETRSFACIQILASVQISGVTSPLLRPTPHDIPAAKRKTATTWVAVIRSIEWGYLLQDRRPLSLGCCSGGRRWRRLHSRRRWRPQLWCTLQNLLPVALLTAVRRTLSPRPHTAAAAVTITVLVLVLILFGIALPPHALALSLTTLAVATTLTLTVTLSLTALTALTAPAIALTHAWPLAAPAIASLTHAGPLAAPAIASLTHAWPLAALTIASLTHAGPLAALAIASLTHAWPPAALAIGLPTAAIALAALSRPLATATIAATGVAALTEAAALSAGPCRQRTGRGCHSHSNQQATKQVFGS